MPQFQLKDFVSIVAGMINHMKASPSNVTDFEVGSAARTLLEAVGIEADELYQVYFAGIMDAIPTSVYKAFDFDLIGEVAATGKVHLSFKGSIETAFTIPAGTVFTSASSTLKFTATADVLVPIGATDAVVIVTCSTPGTIGNIAAGAINAVSGYTLPIGAAITNDAFTSGVDKQTEAERKARFADYIISLARGTPPAIRYAARQARVTNAAGQLVEYVTRVGIDEGRGYVAIYIYSSAGVPSPALIARAKQLIDGYVDATTGALIPGYSPAGTEVEVMAMTERAVPVTLRVKRLPGADTSAAGELAMRNSIATVLAPEFEAVESGGILYVDQLRDAVLTVAGVQRVLVGSEQNEPCAKSEVLRLGVLKVEWLNA